MTTLERRVSTTAYHRYPVDKYWKLMRKIEPEIAAFTGISREVPPWSEPEGGFADYWRSCGAFGFMVHLRHHGFPSPLLDWSRSLYIAAYFAFQENVTRNCAIYPFIEAPKNIAISDPSTPTIRMHGGYGVKTHERHFRQQSAYTICVQRDSATKTWSFVSHESVFNDSSRSKTGICQNVLYKTVIASTERKKALQKFDRYGLNHFTLFGSEEALMNTLSYREFDYRPEGMDRITNDK